MPAFKVVEFRSEGVKLRGRLYRGGSPEDPAPAIDGQVAALVAQVPSWGDELRAPAAVSVEFERLAKALREAEYADWPRTIIGPMPVASPDQATMPSFSVPITAYRWFMEFGAMSGTGWENHATVVESDGPVQLDPQVCIPCVNAPTLVIAAHDDEMPNSNGQIAYALASRFGGPTETLQLDGGHRATFYLESPQSQAAIEVGRAFLLRSPGRVG